MSELVVCPSGLTGHVRGLTGREIEMLGDVKLQRSGRLVDRILDACWSETKDPGPYELGDEGKPDWQQVLVGDRFFLTLRVRAASFGPVYSFDFQCSNPTCREKGGWDLDLVNELPVKALSPEARESFKNGNRFVGELPDGKSFTYRLPVGSDEVRLAKAGSASAAALMIPALLSRIYEIDGVEPTRKRSYFEDAPLRFLFEAVAEMDVNDCGVETSFEVECQKCFTQMEAEIPFGRLFVMDRKDLAAQKRASASRAG